MDLDYDKHPVIGRPPSTLHEHFRVNPMGATSYPKWIEDRIWELLQRPAIIQVWFEDGRTWTRWVMDNCENTIATALVTLDRYARYTPWHYRIIRPDGTIIKEWPGNISEEMA